VPLDALGPAWLFCPADRPERFARAASAADVVVLDLEDGVAPQDRDRARTALVDAPLDPARTVVRINAVGSPDHDLDVRALASTGYRMVMLAKTESAPTVSPLADYEVVALCETPLGVLHAEQIAAAPCVVGLMWGAEDLLVAVGGDSSRGLNGAYRDVARHARSTVLLAAGAHAKAAVDAVYLDIADPEGLAAEAEDSAGSGFGFVSCIHPSQVEVIRAAYRPGAERVEWARRVLEAARAEPGVFRFEGRMVDEPVLRQARRVLERQ
jgi:citrate lyase subunit beta/citryl-CoA lyase